MARAGVWYTDNLLIRDTLIEAPKNFRRCKNITLSNVVMPNAAETLWNCDDVTMQKVSAKGDYFAMNSRNMKILDFQLAGNYPFDGLRHPDDGRPFFRYLRLRDLCRADIAAFCHDIFLYAFLAKFDFQ